jgi:GNAT superfamily N-acetyltransferase
MLEPLRLLVRRWLTLITITEFRGDAAQAASFTESCWRRSYSGSSFYALWTEKYMRWQLFDVPAPERVRRLGAYHGDKLIGFLAAEEMDFTTLFGPSVGTMSSWLSVDPEYARDGVGRALRQGMWAWQLERGASFMIGFVNAGTVRGQGRAFWKREVPGSAILSRPSFWGHILRSKSASEAEFTWWESVGVRVLARLQRAHGDLLKEKVRAYLDADLAQCRAIFDSDATDFGYAWNDARLAHQLGYTEVPRTLLFDRGGGAEALVNYYTLDMVGKTPVRCAVVDFIRIGHLSRRESSAFLRHCLNAMAAEGHDVALILGPPAHPASLLLAGGFLPLPPMQSPIFLPVVQTCFPGGHRLRIHWR